eukprot:3385183-Rhodomonas_salina.1
MAALCKIYVVLQRLLLATVHVNPTNKLQTCIRACFRVWDFVFGDLACWVLSTKMNREKVEGTVGGSAGEREGGTKGGVEIRSDNGDVGPPCPLCPASSDDNSRSLSFFLSNLDDNLKPDCSSGT